MTRKNGENRTRNGHVLVWEQSDDQESARKGMPGFKSNFFYILI